MLLNKNKKMIFEKIETVLFFEFTIFGFCHKFQIQDLLNRHYQIEGLDTKFTSIIQAKHFAKENNIDIED